MGLPIMELPREKMKQEKSLSRGKVLERMLVLWSHGKSPTTSTE